SPEYNEKRGEKKAICAIGSRSWLLSKDKTPHAPVGIAGVDGVCLERAYRWRNGVRTHGLPGKAFVLVYQRIQREGLSYVRSFEVEHDQA
ncbi:MAG TPA: hypothetical protein VKR81_09620, partial [Candidatus Binatia bacterium]|nr:hypothetical protein [Candidatus Binatia bacterium]